MFQGIFPRVIGFINGNETPVQVYRTRRLDQCTWNCIARYHPSALDAVTHTDPTTRAPVKYHTSEARALCSVYAFSKLLPELIPTAASIGSDWLEELGLDPSIMTDDEANDAAIVRIFLVAG